MRTPPDLIAALTRCVLPGLGTDLDPPAFREPVTGAGDIVDALAMREYTVRLDGGYTEQRRYTIIASDLVPQRLDIAACG